MGTDATATETPTIAAGEVLNLEAAASFARVDGATIRQWCHDGLPYLPTSGDPITGRGPWDALFLRDELLAWLRQHMRRAAARPEGQGEAKAEKRKAGRPKGSGLPKREGGRPWAKP